MKKIIILSFCILLCWTTALSGCSDTVSVDPASDGVLTVVCTTFAGYDFTRQITKDAEEGTVRLVFLGKAGQDMHGYEPTAADITTMSTADLVVCLGSTTETWLDAALKAALNASVARVNMTEVCDTMAETPTEGMDTSAAHDHDHEHEAGTDHSSASDGLIGTDEHIWLAPSNAIRISEAIGAALAEVAPAKAACWQAGTAAYVAELTALQQDYAAMMAEAVRDTILIADRYPFAYLVRELGLTCYAAFPGCSSETSASFATQTFLIEKTRELALPYIFTIDGSDGTVAATVAEAGGADVLTLDSLQVVTDLETTYVAVMRRNLTNLRKALC